MTKVNSVHHSAKVIGILVGAVVQLLVVVLYFSRSERRRQQYRIALAEFRAIDACMSKTLNAVCHELRNPLHGLQVRTGVVCPRRFAVLD
jgi:type II secretory pathway component PulM